MIGRWNNDWMIDCWLQICPITKIKGWYKFVNDKNESNDVVLNEYDIDFDRNDVCL